MSISLKEIVERINIKTWRLFEISIAQLKKYFIQESAWLSEFGEFKRESSLNTKSISNKLN